MKNVNIAVKPHEFPEEPMPWESLFPKTGINHRDRKCLVTSRSSVLVAGLCEATWGEDFWQHEVQKESHTNRQGTQTLQWPLGSLCHRKSELREEVGPWPQTFMEILSLKHPFALQYVGCGG